MDWLAYLLLPVLVGILLFRMRQDKQEFEAFKALVASSDRQRMYKKWLLESFLLFGCSSILSLLLMGQGRLLSSLYSAFRTLIPNNFFTLLDNSASEGGSFVSGLLIGAIFGGILLGVVLGILLKKKKPQKPLIVGDVEAFFPRNKAEGFWAALLAINAGFSEELFFRLLLPLLFYLVFKQTILALVLAALLFGLAHFYQGWAGIMITTLLGAAFTVLYLATGNIWLVMLVHALIDLNGLLLQPYLHKRFFQA